MYRKIFDKSRSTPNSMNLSENITLKIMPYSALKRRELLNFLNFFSGRAYTCTFSHNYMKMYIHNFSNIYRREYIRNIGFSSKIYVLILCARSSNSTILIIPIFRTAPVPKYLRLHHWCGERSFQYAAPNECNKLPLIIRESPSLAIFKNKLKTFLFQPTYNS